LISRTPADTERQPFVQGDAERTLNEDLGDVVSFVCNPHSISDVKLTR
jgi:hypothetical protein